jgi:hypothetical protein
VREGTGGIAVERRRRMESEEKENWRQDKEE